MSTLPQSLEGVEWLFFDVFGTVLDWKSHISSTLQSISTRLSLPASPSHTSAEDDLWRDKAQEWRTRFMAHIKTRQGKREAGGMDEVHRKLLDDLLEEWGWSAHWKEDDRAEAVEAWHSLPGWPDAQAGLRRLKKRFVLSTLTNGDTTVLVQLCRNADLVVDNHIAGDTINTYKPDPAMYKQAIRLSRLNPGEGKVAMVAAHGYDLDAARSHGMRTIYINRPTEDLQDEVTAESAKERGFDLFIEIGGEEDGGLVELAKLFGL